MSIIKIGIVEDDPHWQKILSNFLNAYDDFQVVWITSEKDTAISLARETKKTTDVIIMDLNLSFNERDGIYATYEICSKNDIKVIVLTSYVEGEHITLQVNFQNANSYTIKLLEMLLLPEQSIIF